MVAGPAPGDVVTDSVLSGWSSPRGPAAAAVAPTVTAAAATMSVAVAVTTRRRGRANGFIWAAPLAGDASGDGPALPGRKPVMSCPGRRSTVQVSLASDIQTIPRVGRQGRCRLLKRSWR